MLVIGLCSPEPGCGKDSFTRINNIPRFSFADILKQAATKLGWDGSKCQKGRTFLIDIGTSVRKYNPDFFVDTTIEDIRVGGFSISGITDLRFYNEWEKLHEAFRDDLIIVGIERNTDSGFKDDVTQIDYNKIPKDFIIHNDGDYESFEINCREVYNAIRANYDKLL